jgi:hypothetical protein
MDWLFKFPFVIIPDTDAMDLAVRGFAADNSAVFDAIKAGLQVL